MDDVVVDFLKLFLLSYVLAISTTIAYPQINGFFTFLGWLFLIVSALGLFHQIDIKSGGLVLTSSSTVIFFLLAWFVPLA